MSIISRTPGRPEGTEGDTGLEFRGWYAAASSTLSHAVSDDDPSCVMVLCREADIAVRKAHQVAKNDRQVEAAVALLWSIERVYEIAERTPPIVR